MNPITKIRDMFRPAEFAPVYDPVAADREYRERMRTDWRFRQAEQDRQVEELAASMSLDQARELFAREQRFELGRLACDHDHQSDCDACEAAYEREYGPVPPEYEASEIRRRAVSRIMTRDDPDAVAAAAQAIYQAQERAGAARAEVIARARRGMSYDEARALLRKQEEYDYVGADGLDSRQVEAARRVVASGAKYAISRTQPLPVVPARLGAAGSNAALLLLRAEDAAAERALTDACAAAGADPEDPRVEAAEERLAVARRDLQTAQGQARAGRDVNVWWLDELSRKAHRASDELDYLRNHPTLPGAPAAIERTEAELAGAVWDRQAAVQALTSAADRPAERSAGQVFEDTLTEEAEARRQLDEALDAGAPGAALDQAEARWQAAAQDRGAAEQDNDGQDSAGTSADVVAPTVRGRLLEHARWAYEHAERIDREASQARERGDFSGASEWSCRALGLRDSAREFERGARELGSDAVPPATVQALAESLDQARQHHERAMQIEREQDQAGQRGQYRDFFDTRGCQALGLRDSAREFERDARASTGPRKDPATPGGFGFVAPTSRDTVGAAVESAQDAVNNLSAQPTTTRERAQTGRWATDQHEHGTQHGAGYGAEYGGGLSADGQATGW